MQPEAIQTIKFPGGAMCVMASMADTARATWLDPATYVAEPVRNSGRQAAWFVEGEFGPAVLRHYRRGGLRARFGRTDYFWMGATRTRSFAEFGVLSRLDAMGLSVPRPIAAAYWRRGISYRAAILIERIPDAHTLATSLDRADPVDVAQAIFSMHEAGVWHADLNAHNILIDAMSRIWLIDFDRAHTGVVTQAQRRRNLLRLRRSLVKVCGAPGAQWWDGLDTAFRQQG